MAVLLLKKGQTKALPGGGGAKFTGGVGWDAAPDADADGDEKIDLDLFVLRIRKGKAEPDIIAWVNESCYRPDLGHNSEGNPYMATPEVDVLHKGDDRSGAESATGYDETVVIDTSKAPDDVERYVFLVTYYEDPETGSGKTLGMATNIVCGFKDESTGHELKAPVEDDHGFDVTAHVATISRTPDGEWSMTNDETGYSESAVEVLRAHFGVS